MSAERSQTAKSAVWSLVENGGLALISLGTLVIYTHLLSTAEFGLFSVVLALIEMLQVLVTMFFHDALVQRPQVTERHFDTAFSFAMASSLVLMFGCCAAAPWFAASVGEPRVVPVLCAMTLCFPAAALSATIVPRQRRSFAFRSLALRSLFGRLAGAAIGVALIVAGAGVWGLIAQQILIQAVGSAFLWKTCERRPRLRLGATELKELAGFGMYAVGSLFLSFGIKRLFTVAAGIFLGVEAAGYLNLSFRTIDVFWSIASTAATQVALPMLASLQSDVPRLKRAFQQAMGLVCLILYASFLGIGLLAPEVVELMFGAKWLASAPYVTALSCLVLIQAPRVLIAPLLTALGRPRDLVLGKAVELAFIAVAVAVTRVPTLGWAVAIWVVRELVALPVTVRMLRSATGFSVADQFRGAGVPLLASLIMVAAVLLTRHALPPDFHALSRLLVLALVGAVAFVGTVAILQRELLARLFGFVQAARGRGHAAPPATLELSRSP